MNTNNLNTALYEKMTAEQDKFRDWLKNGYVAVCIEPDGGCATMLFFEKWSDHHPAAMQARLLAGHDIQTG